VNGTINSGLRRVAYGGGKMDWQNIAANAFGQAIGNSIGESIRYNAQLEKLKTALRDRLQLNKDNFENMWDGFSKEQKELYVKSGMHLPGRRNFDSEDTRSDVENDYTLGDKLAANENIGTFEIQDELNGNISKQENSSINLAWTSILKSLGLDVHQQINADALPELPEEQRILIDIATILVDELQDSSESYMHAMHDGNDDRMNGLAAMQKANAWIRFNLYESAQASASGDIVSALFNEGIAIHALQDSTSPSHRDAITGNLKKWTDPDGFFETIKWLFSGISHVSHEAHNPGVGSNAYNVTRDVHNWLSSGYVPEGNLIRRYGVDESDNENQIRVSDDLSPLYYGPETG